MSALALSTLKLGLRHVNEVFGLSRLRHPGPILGRFPPRFSQVVMRLVAVMLFKIRFLFLALDSFIVIFGALVLEKEFKFYKSRFILRSQLRKSFFLKKLKKVEKTGIISTKSSLRCTPSVILGIQ